MVFDINWSLIVWLLLLIQIITVCSMTDSKVIYTFSNFTSDLKIICFNYFPKLTRIHFLHPKAYIFGYVFSVTLYRSSVRKNGVIVFALPYYKVLISYLANRWRTKHDRDIRRNYWLVWRIWWYHNAPRTTCWVYPLIPIKKT